MTSWWFQCITVHGPGLGISGENVIVISLLFIWKVKMCKACQILGVLLFVCWCVCLFVCCFCPSIVQSPWWAWGKIPKAIAIWGWRCVISLTLSILLSSYLLPPFFSYIPFPFSSLLFLGGGSAPGAIRNEAKFTCDVHFTPWTCL